MESKLQDSCENCQYLRPVHRENNLEYKCGHPNCKCDDSIQEFFLNGVPGWCPLRADFICRAVNMCPVLY